MVTSPRERPIGTLSVDRAFVLQIEAEADFAAGRLGGRVEHVVSGRAKRFRSLRQLLAFLGSAAGSPRQAATGTASSGGATARQSRRKRARAYAAPTTPAGKRRRR
jgi:hypothetical protein